jgi:methylmalonyl-CoA/ethylmalonyl-CoA epimerase
MTPAPLDIPEDLTQCAVVFHHIGYATASIEREIPHFARLGYRPEPSDFVDPVQGIRGWFLDGPGPRIELLENHGDAVTLAPWLEKGVRMYHLAWETDDLDRVVEIHRRLKSRVMVEPVPSVYFAGRRIAFVMQRNGFLAEYIGA